MHVPRQGAKNGSKETFGVGGKFLGERAYDPGLTLRPKWRHEPRVLSSLTLVNYTGQWSRWTW